MKIRTLIFMLYCGFSYAQTVYTFDYEVQYEFKMPSKNLNHVVTYYINTKDNSYYAKKIPQKNSKSKLIVQDYKGLRAEQVFKDEKFEKGVITFEKEKLIPFGNTYVYQANNYRFNKYPDTIVNNKNLSKVVLKSISSDWEKQNKLGRLEYLIDTSYDIKPMLEFGTGYEIWKLRKNVPNGLIVQCTLYNLDYSIFISEVLKTPNEREFKVVFPKS